VSQVAGEDGTASETHGSTLKEARSPPRLLAVLRTAFAYSAAALPHAAHCMMSKLLLIDDEEDVRYSFRRIFDSPEIELTSAASGEEGLALIPVLKPDLVLSDVRMGRGMTGIEFLRQLRQRDPKLLVILMTAYGSSQIAIEAMKLGAYDYLLKPFDVPKLKQIVFAALKAARDMKEVVSYDPVLEAEDHEQGIVGHSEPMQQVFKLIGQVAGTEATVLITGETGTGKELVARAIYHHSARSGKPFLAINCAAIPEQLLESELFGHEKGAFTGAAAQRIGRFEQCHGGTIFLDEIGDMSPTTQTKILRVLQSGSFERVGGGQTLQVDVRVIAATNKELEPAVAAREFREDLFYRLNVVRIRLPALRERRSDVPLMVSYFLKKFARDEQKSPRSITAEALRRLEQHDWPGNVRQLENVVRRALVVCKGDAILVGDLPPEIAGSSAVSETPAAPPSTAPTAPGSVATPAAPPTPAELAQQLFRWARVNSELPVIDAVERELVSEALRETKGNQIQAAKILGMTRATLRKRIERFGIRRGLVVE
jgi:two-component system nitrogen regulation response regulator GlnG